MERERDSVLVRRACLWLHARKPRPALPPPPGRRHASCNIDRPLSVHLHTLLILILPLPLPTYTTYTPLIMWSPAHSHSYHWHTRIGTRRIHITLDFPQNEGFTPRTIWTEGEMGDARNISLETANSYLEAH